MADFVFNIAKGAAAEKVRDGAGNLLVLLMEALEADNTAKDYDDLSTLLAAPGNTEQDDGSYARLTGLTGVVTVDDTNDRVDIDITDTLLFSSLSGDPITDLIVAYEESGSDAGRIPLTAHDLTATPDGSDLTVNLNTAGFFRAT